MHDNLAQVTYWWTRFEAQDLFLCFVQSERDDVMYLTICWQHGDENFMVFFLISHRNEKDKLLSFKQMSIFDLVLYSIMQPIMPHLNFLWKRAFYIKKISYMNLHMNFFLKARRHWTTSHKVNKQFTSCKYLLQACLSHEIQASALSTWVSGK